MRAGRVHVQCAENVVVLHVERARQHAHNPAVSVRLGIEVGPAVVCSHLAGVGDLDGLEGG
jgi:hypothetical protein